MIIFKYIICGLLMMVVVGNIYAVSLFDEKNYKSIVGDHSSHNVGESITVLIYEQASAATSAGTDTSESLGVGVSARGITDRKTEKNIGSLNVDNDFSGGGTINRTGKLVASVTVSIVEVLSNGELLVAGEQVIEFNEEKQFIKLSGRVRREDISASNTVLSTRVADANITYVGDGLLGKRQKPGYLSRFFNWLF